MARNEQSLNTEAAAKALENLRTRLLDLTARNRLINFRHTKKASLRVIDELPDQLVESLLSESEMRFLPVPEPTREELIAEGYIQIDGATGQEIRLRKDPTAEEWAALKGLETSYEVPSPTTHVTDDRHADDAIQTLLYPYELEARLKNLMQMSESAIQEMGANILYLAFGFLEWFETDNDKPRIAPLFLVPVTLHKGRLNQQTKTYEYTITYSGEDIIPNLSLREKLRADFALALPELDENTRPEVYFQNVLELIQENQPRWRVRRFISLALLNFSKLLMYLDLDPARWPKGRSITDHPVVMLFLAGYDFQRHDDESSAVDLGFGEEYPIDELEDVHVRYPLIDDADSSQHSALIDALDGKNLVIEGPPGTGKSQTITNLIAAAMAQGKRVLFVAEKLAALEVVRRRLDMAGLGEFCLELHSHKSRKQGVIEDIANRLAHRGQYRKPKDIEADIERYEELKQALTDHVECISRLWKTTGRTLHEIFMAATRFRRVIDINPELLHPQGYDGNNFNPSAQRRTADQVEAFQNIYQAVSDQIGGESALQDHPWYGIQNTDLQIFDLDRVRATLDEWQRTLLDLGERRMEIAEKFGYSPDHIPQSKSELKALLDDLERVPVPAGDELLDTLPLLRGETLAEVRQYLGAFETIEAHYSSLKEKVEFEVLHDLSVVDDIRAGSERLADLVQGSVELGALAESIKRMVRLKEESDELEETLREVRAAVGEAAALYLLPTKAGFTEFLSLMELVAKLDSSHLHRRDPCFDNDELDELLPQLRNDLDRLNIMRGELRVMLDADKQLTEGQSRKIEQSIDAGDFHPVLLDKAAKLNDLLPGLKEEVDALNELNAELDPVFHIEALGTSDELRQLDHVLDAGGSLRWFKGSWRRARKQLLGLATHERISYSTLKTLLRKAAEFAERRDRLNDNESYNEALGELLNGLYTDISAVEAMRDWFQNVGAKATEYADSKKRFVNQQRYVEMLGSHFRGADTDVGSLESLRKWYREVRQQYGIGFGKRVALGTAVLDLPADVAKGIRSLHERGAHHKLRSLLEELDRLRSMFTSASELQADTNPLAGESGSVSNTRVQLEQALSSCTCLAADNGVAIQELARRGEELHSLKNWIDKWSASNYDQRVFEGRLGLKAGPDVDNSAALSRLRNTLAIAGAVEEQVKAAEVQQRIYQKPDASTFDALSALTAQLRSGMEREEAAYGEFSELVRLDESAWSGAGKLEDLVNRNERARSNAQSLQNWLDYVRVRDQLGSMGFARLATEVEKGSLKLEQVKDGYRAGVFDMLAREILRELPQLGRFSGHSQEGLRQKFREYDDRLKRLQCERIAWQIDQTDIPVGNYAARVSERTDLALLEHECSKKKRHIAIRELVNRAGSAVIAVKPCFMMGPMSVAQYLSPGKVEFDLVVMDEASQIKPQDAIGAVARGGQLVVVGDPKQLPPTSFFDRVIDDEEEDLTAIEESESILDATRPMFPGRRLRWHYRSRHESLIAFSNHAFYDSDLVLFPSPYKEDESYGIRYSRVRRGCFVNRRNLEEARIVAESVREHLRQRPDESLGVVAMNAEQRLQIESTIESLAKEDLAFQQWLEQDAQKNEPLFIKNLENVQGDERDVIFISMTYGPAEPGGKVFQRFGPINSDVGWRRLNVLFTRSKKRMHIFSSMGADDIVADSMAKRGVQALRNFLSYCETGVLHATERDTGRPPDSDFEIAVIAALREKGFECVPQVGVAGYFLDVAVIDPGNSGRFLMGIECDGATYHSAKSTRDRDRLRQMILERLGWRIRRIWSTDWFKNPQAELQPIIRELHTLKSETPAQPEVESEDDVIAEIVEHAEREQAIAEEFILEGAGLREQLIQFDKEVIRKVLPDTPDNQRLLRPAMLEALVEYAPTSKAEFLEYVPGYLRKATSAAEGPFLEQVLEILNASMG